MKKYNIITVCMGERYSIIEPHFRKRVSEKCPNAKLRIVKNHNLNLNLEYGWWDVVRMNEIINLLEIERIPVVHCDIDIIIEKDIEPLLDINQDIIFSKECNGNKAFPQNCSEMIGFGICTGFYIIKPTESAINFLKILYNNMISRLYDTYSDQITLMNMIILRNYTLVNNSFMDYNNTIISLEDDVNILVLDFDIITRDPEYTKTQFANHINIDNVGGSFNFIYYYYNELETLPLTCRCGKIGNNDICNHRKIKK
jgi:hypothetical protein